MSINLVKNTSKVNNESFTIQDRGIILFCYILAYIQRSIKLLDMIKVKIEPKEEPHSDIHQLNAIDRVENVIGPVTHNTVCTFKIYGLEGLTLQEIANILRGRWDKDKFAAAVMIHFKNPMFTMLLYSSGTAVIAGPRSVEVIQACLHAARMYIYRLSKRFTCCQNLQVCNIHATATLPFTLDMDRLRKELDRESLFHKENFGGLKYVLRDKDNGAITFLMFHTGNLVMTGAQRREQLVRALELIYPKLRRFKLACNSHLLNAMNSDKLQENNTQEANIKLLTESVHLMGIK